MNKQEASQETLVQKKKESSEFSKKRFFKFFNIILKDFHENLSISMTQLTNEKKLFFLKEFGKLYYSLKDKSEELYTAKIWKDNELLLIPYMHNNLKQIFEKFTVELEQKYNEFVLKTDSSISMQQNVNANFKSIIDDQINRSQVLALDIEKFFENQKQFKMKEQLEVIPDKKESFNLKLKEIFENQQKINLKIQSISEKLNTLESRKNLEIYNNKLSPDSYFQMNNEVNSFNQNFNF